MFRQFRTYNHYTLQLLWDHIQPSQNYGIYNGGVEAVSNLLGRAYHKDSDIKCNGDSAHPVNSMILNHSAGAATAYGISFTELRWEWWGELALGGFSGLGSAALFLMTFTSNIWVCYTGYAIFKCLYMMLITIAM